MIKVFPGYPKRSSGTVCVFYETETWMIITILFHENGDDEVIFLKRTSVSSGISLLDAKIRESTLKSR